MKTTNAAPFKVGIYYALLFISTVFFSLGYHWGFILPIVLIATLVIAWIKGNQFKQVVGGIEMKGSIVIAATIISQLVMISICFLIGKLISAYLLN